MRKRIWRGRRKLVTGDFGQNKLPFVSLKDYAYWGIPGLGIGRENQASIPKMNGKISDKYRDWV